MRQRTSTVREYVPVGRVSWLMIALVQALAALLLFHYQALGAITLIVAAGAALTGLLGFVMLPPGRAYSFATRTRGTDAAGRPAPKARAAYNQPVSRVPIVVLATLFGLLAVLAHRLGAPVEIIWVLALCSGSYAIVLLLPDRVRRLFAWDLNL